MCHAEPCSHAAIFCVLPFPSTHTSSREMATNFRSCCSGGRDTRTAPSWATRPWQWESLTWLRYRVLGAEGSPTWPSCASTGQGAGLAGSHCCECSGLLAGYHIERGAASCHCVTLSGSRLSVCLGYAAPNRWWAAPGPPQQHEGCKHSSG